MSRQRTLLVGAAPAVGLAAAVAVVAALALGAGQARATAARADVQKVTITIRGTNGGDVKGPIAGTFAIRPTVAVRLTIVNYTHEFHTFTIPGLGVSAMIRPAAGHSPRTTTVTFTAARFGTFAWYCVLCERGVHGAHHAMRGKVFAVIGS